MTTRRATRRAGRNKGLTLDAGALIALERSDRRILAWIDETLEAGLGLAVPAGALAQVWRDGAHQVRLVRLLGSSAVELCALDGQRAREAGALCGLRRTNDVIDASVVLCARARGHVVATSDPFDLRRLDRSVALLVV